MAEAKWLVTANYAKIYSLKCWIRESDLGHKSTFGILNTNILLLQISNYIDH